MNTFAELLTPDNAALVPIDHQAGLAFGVTSWLQVLLELQRDWTRHATYDAARNVVVANGGGYGIGLNYVKDMSSH